RAGARATRERGIRALRGAAIVACVLVGLAGLSLVLVPRMDHWWLAWLEASVPAAQTMFLTSDERDTRRDTVEDAERSVAEIERVRTMQRQAQWATHPVTEETQERMRQYLAGRAEMLAGDRLVLRSIQEQARARQRWWLRGPPAVLRPGRAPLPAPPPPPSPPPALTPFPS